MQTKLQYPEWGGLRDILYCTHLLIALGEISTHIARNISQQRQFSYLHDLLALSIELETHNYSI